MAIHPNKKKYCNIFKPILKTTERPQGICAIPFSIFKKREFHTTFAYNLW